MPGKGNETICPHSVVIAPEAAGKARALLWAEPVTYLARPGVLVWRWPLPTGDNQLRLSFARPTSSVPLRATWGQ